MAKFPNSFDGITLLNSTVLFKRIVETSESDQRADTFSLGSRPIITTLPSFLSCTFLASF